MVKYKFFKVCKPPQSQTFSLRQIDRQVANKEINYGSFNAWQENIVLYNKHLYSPFIQILVSPPLSLKRANAHKRTHIYSHLRTQNKQLLKQIWVRKREKSSNFLTTYSTTPLLKSIYYSVAKANNILTRIIISIKCVVITFQL